MLGELETGLVALIRQSEFGKRLRQVDTLPDLEGDSLIGRFTTDAPAVYVAMGSFSLKGRNASPKYGIACVARNSRGHQAARHGDGVAIGLYEMLEAVMEMIDGATVGFSPDGQGGFFESVSFEALSCDLINSEALYQKGIYAGIVQIQTTSEIFLGGTLANLADFKTFHTDYDVEPHQASAEHAKWLQEPPDKSTSAPELSDTLTLPQE